MVEEVELLARLDREEAVGLRLGGGDLREELGAGDPDGEREADVGEHVRPQLAGDLRGRPEQVLRTPDVEERLVDRDRLDERGDVAEAREDGVARLRVGLHPGLDHDRLGTQHPGLPTVHRRADPAALRLVATGEHDAAPHDDGAAPEARLVALLDGRVERVEVGVEDRRAACGRRGHGWIVERTHVRVHRDRRDVSPRGQTATMANRRYGTIVKPPDRRPRHGRRAGGEAQRRGAPPSRRGAGRRGPAAAPSPRATMRPSSPRRSRPASGATVHVTAFMRSGRLRVRMPT